MMDKDKQPGISFDSIMLVKEDFWRDPYVPDEIIPDLKMNMNWGNQDNHYVVELTVNLSLYYENSERFKLHSKFIGMFSILVGSENMEIENFIKNNSAALMFPYIREHISSVTQKSGIRPILLPPINVIALLNNSEKDIIDTN